MMTFSDWWDDQDVFGSNMHAARVAFEDATRAARSDERQRCAEIAASFKEDGEITGSVQEAIAKRILEG